MTLAVDTLSGGWQALFYGLAVLCFLLAFFLGNVYAPPEQRRIASWGGLVAIGLALAFFPSFWNSLAVA